MLISHQNFVFKSKLKLRHYWPMLIAYFEPIPPTISRSLYAYINYQLHWNWIQYQAAHPELRCYTITCKLGCWNSESSHRRNWSIKFGGPKTILLLLIWTLTFWSFSPNFSPYLPHFLPYLGASFFCCMNESSNNLERTKSQRAINLHGLIQTFNTKPKF